MDGFELGSDGPSLILVGVDGSRTSLRAAAYAAGMARRERCPLVVVYVKKTPATAGMDAGAGIATVMASDQMEEELRDLIDLRSANLGLAVRFEVRTGDPFAELVRAADELRADAVVVGASESAGHRIVGSLAGRLVKSGRWPVTVVP